MLAGCTEGSSVDPDVSDDASEERALSVEKTYLVTADGVERDRGDHVYPC